MNLPRPTKIQKAFVSLQSAQEFLKTLTKPEKYIIVQLVKELTTPDVAIVGYLLEEIPS
jgi:hypothetical protein